jgi:succinyl-CoA synthetase beta subunit
MRLAEIDGKALLRRHGLAVPRGALLRAGDDPPAEAAQWPGHMLKAQVLDGGRGKRGLVRRLADLTELAPVRRRMTAALDDPQAPLLLEEAVPIGREIYLAIRIDGTRQGLELLLAREGGEDVETTKALVRIPLAAATTVTADALYPDLATLFTRDVAARLARYAVRLTEIARREDLELIEINPLVLTPDGQLVACDAKIVRDDSAEFRHDPEEFPLSRLLADSRSLAERIKALLAWVAAEPLPKPLFVGIAAGHAATRKMSTEAAVAKLAAAGIAAFTDPIALVRAVAHAVGQKPGRNA